VIEALELAASGRRFVFSSSASHLTADSSAASVTDVFVGRRR